MPLAYLYKYRRGREQVGSANTAEMIGHSSQSMSLNHPHFTQHIGGVEASMSTVIDTTSNCTAILTSLKQLGYGTIIRYYSSSAWKRLSQSEAIATGNAGLQQCVVYQNRQNQRADFTLAKGRAAGNAAHSYASNVIYQPPGTAIYFSVDFDASESEVNNSIIPYFNGVREGLAEAGDGTPNYRIGVYGSGRVCRMLSDASLVDFTWLSQSTGFGEYQAWLSSQRWHLKQNMPTRVSGIDCDTDDTNPSLPDFGAFLLPTGSLGPAAPSGPPPSGVGQFRVIARDGLRLRTGPSTDFEVRSIVSFGTILKVLSRSGDWALVDLSGDAAADGYVYSSFLRPA